MRTLGITLCAVAIVVACSAGARDVEVTDFEVRVNTINTAVIHLTFTFSAKVNDTLSRLREKDNPVSFRLRRVNDDVIVSECTGGCIFWARDSTISFKVANPTQQLAADIHSGDEPVYLELLDDVEVVMADGSVYKLTREAVKRHSLTALKLTDRQFEMLMRARAGDHTVYEK
ncbi:MAG: hypothetical protein JSV52_15585, partial [Candidatus Zixiibacteriota bacterium]